MDTQIAVRNGNGHGGGAALMTQDADSFIIPGMETVQPSELRLPILRLIQAQSKVQGAGDHVGEWHNSVTGEFAESVELLIVGIAKGRIMFSEEYSADNKPQCASNDGAAPRPEFVGTAIETVQLVRGRKQIADTTIKGACADCPFSVWGDDGTPPRCNQTETFAGVGEDGLPAVFQLRSASMKNVSALKTLLASNGIRRAIRLGSHMEENDKGRYSVAVFTPGVKPSAEWQQTAKRLASMGNLAARNAQDVSEADTKHQSSDTDLDAELSTEDLDV